MTLDWNRIGSSSPQLLLRPREIFAALPNKPWSYLRQEQGEALEDWFDRKDIGNHRNHNLLNAYCRPTGLARFDPLQLGSVHVPAGQPGTSV